MSKIKQVIAREILDSRSNPTVECVVILDNGQTASASVPSGASTGKYEALELRDGDEKRFSGKGVLKACENVNKVLGREIIGFDVTLQEEIDGKLIETDGTKDKSKYGANSILSISLAVAKAAAASSGVPLYQWIWELGKKYKLAQAPKVPTPIFNLINGGLHGAGNLDFQEFHIIPSAAKTFPDALQIGVEVYQTLGGVLSRRGAINSVGDEGGYAPNLFTNTDALEVIVESIRNTSYVLGRDIFLGLDIAASTFFKDGKYTIRDKSAPLDENSFIEYYKSLNDEYNLTLLEDPLAEDSWAGWTALQNELGGQLVLVGDDLLSTNPERLKRAITEKACGAILVKPNQIGTLTETISVIKTAKEAGFKIIVSHRSGETNDYFIADFAVGVASDYVKFGAPARGERVAKYNRLLAISTLLVQ